MRDKTEFYMLYDQFAASFFGGGSSFKWSTQKVITRSKKFGYYPEVVSLTRAAVERHFYKPIHKTEFHTQGSIGVTPPVDVDKHLRWICVDCDTKELTDKARSNIIPVYKKYGINYLIELGGDSLERCHIWTKTDAPAADLKTFITRIFVEAGCDPVKEYDEIFGINKLRNIIRFPLGAHLSRAGTIFPIELHDGELSTDPIDFMEAWINLNSLDLKLIESVSPTIIAPEIRKEREVVAPKNQKPRRLIYKAVNLPLPACGSPDFIRPAIKNCQAINRILHRVVEGKMIEERGELHHAAGLYLNGMAVFNDIKAARRLRENVEQGKDWFTDLVNTYRLRDDSSHNWDSAAQKKDAESNPDKYFTSCKTWDDKFDECRGCPYRNMIKSPKELIFGTQMRRKAVGNLNLVSYDEIRNKLFPQFKETVRKHLDDSLPENMLLCSSMGSGKSVLIDNIIADSAKRGFKTLLAVPTGKLAMEHRSRLKEQGVDAYCLLSHKNIFNPDLKLVTFECPSYEPIQAKLGLGVSASTIKKDDCEQCPFRNECAYPLQYKEVMEPEYKVVIIQHAHLQVQEIIRNLMLKDFDLLVIDESFIDTCFSSMEIKLDELNILEKIPYSWAQMLYNWLTIKVDAVGKLVPEEDELKYVREKFTATGLEWRIPQFIQYFNQERIVNKYTGIEVVYELPNIPLKIFTDATPPARLIERLTGLNKVVQYGNNELLDHRKIHPDNKIIQIIDKNAASVSFLNSDENFNNVMLKVGELSEITYADKKILITCYKRDVERLKLFFIQHRAEFPTAPERIVYTQMSKGTNAFEDFDVQFMLAGIFFGGADYLKTAYKYKAVENYYLKKRGEKVDPNIYPFETSQKDTNISRIQFPFKRNEAIKSHGMVFEYDQYSTSAPDDSWHKLIYDYNTATTQQAMRLRFKPDKPRVIYILNNLYMHTMLVTESITYEEFIKPLDFDPETLPELILNSNSDDL